MRYHFIGIGGIGMSGLAKILLKRRKEVSGSDLVKSYVVEGLIREGAEVKIGHSAEYVAPDMTVVYNTDIKKDNPEYCAAHALQCRVLHRADLLKELAVGQKTLSVTGMHGKTTTSSLLSALLYSAGLDPSVAVGGILPQLTSNARSGEGSYFVIEACESDGTFLTYDTYGAIVTNIDLEHMDYFRTEETVLQAFDAFIQKVACPDLLFWCKDDLRLQSLQPRGISYGFHADSALRISHFRQAGWQIFFTLHFEGKEYQDICLSLIGKHNSLNGAAVFGLGLRLGIDEQTIRAAFTSFAGVGRRCEKKGESQDILFLDDYAHHPTEIAAILQAIRSAIGERRLVAVYQPHRYTRTRDCLGLFSQVFDSADHLFLTDIYASSESPIPGITIERVLADIEPVTRPPLTYLPRAHLAQNLLLHLKPHDVCVTLGAGDITSLGPQLLFLLP